MTWWTSTVSVRGTEHVKYGTPCQDAVCVRRDKHSLVMVVCDGAGSAPDSHYGSRAVAEAVANLLISNAAEFMSGKLTGKSVLAVGLAAIDAVARRRRQPRDHFPCTLVAVVLRDDCVKTCHLGDGAIYMLQAEVPVCISPPLRGNDGGTYFVTTPGALPRTWHLQLPPNATGLLVTSDGADCLRNEVTGEVSSYITRLVAELDLHGKCSLRERLLNDIQPTTGDDISLAAARKPYVAGVYGCSRCLAPHGAVALKVNRRGSALIGKCRNCGALVLRYPDIERGRVSYRRAQELAGYTRPLPSAVTG